MDGALEVLRVGCDKEAELEADFVYWVPSTEAVREEAAERVIAKIDKLGGSEKKRLQKVARAVVEKKLTSVLIDMPVFFQDSLLVVVRSWLQKHLYEVLDDLLFEEEAVFAICGALPEVLGKALAAEDFREGMVDMYRKKSVLSAQMILEHVDNEFEKFVCRAPPGLQDVFREHKDKWVPSEAASIVKKFLLSEEWRIEPLVRLDEATNTEAASKAWQLFSKYHGSKLADAVVSFNALMENGVPRLSQRYLIGWIRKLKRNVG